jgi:hypothetical protein
MEQSPTWHTNCPSASQQISHIQWSPKVHYHMKTRLPLVPVQSQVTPVHAIPCYFFEICSKLSSHLCLGLSSNLFSSGIPPKYCMHLSRLPYVSFTLSVSSFLMKSHLVRSKGQEGLYYDSLSSSGGFLLLSPTTYHKCNEGINFGTVHSIVFKNSNYWK